MLRSSMSIARQPRRSFPVKSSTASTLMKATGCGRQRATVQHRLFVGAAAARMVNPDRRHGRTSVVRVACRKMTYFRRRQANRRAAVGQTVIIIVPLISCCFGHLLSLTLSVTLTGVVVDVPKCAYYMSFLLPATPLRAPAAVAATQ